MTWLWAVGIAWVLLGTATAILMARRGHDVATWATLGLVFGPVAPLLAVRSISDEPAGRARVVARGGESGHGTVDLVVGIDGSQEAEAALRCAVRLHGDNVGRLVVATATPFDAPADPDVGRWFGLAATGLAPERVTTVELRGEPAAALQRFAVDEELDLIVVGARGRGRSASPLGSVATRLAAGSPVPVLIGPGRPGHP